MDWSSASLSSARVGKVCTGGCIKASSDDVLMDALSWSLGHTDAGSYDSMLASRNGSFLIGRWIIP